jgi:hypothetical protein
LSTSPKDFAPERVRHSEPQAKNPRDARGANEAESFYWGSAIIAPERVRHSEPQAKNPRDARRANDAESFYWGLTIIARTRPSF